MHPKFEQRIADTIWECCPDDLYAVTLTHPDRTRIGIHDPLRDGWWVHEYGDWTWCDQLMVAGSEPLGDFHIEGRDHD